MGAIISVGSILTLALSIFVAPLAADAQQPKSIPRLGVVTPTEVSAIEAFRQGLRDLGYIEGQNITIEYRSAEGKSERCSELIAELVRLNMDVLATASVPCALAAKQATQTIPVVIGAMSRERADALIVPTAPFTFVHRTQIVELAAKSRLPEMYGLREFVEPGGLMAYATSLAHLWCVRPPMWTRS